MLYSVAGDEAVEPGRGADRGRVSGRGQTLGEGDEGADVALGAEGIDQDPHRAPAITGWRWRMEGVGMAGASLLIGRYVINVADQTSRLSNATIRRRREEQRQHIGRDRDQLGPSAASSPTAPSPACSPFPPLDPNHRPRQTVIHLLWVTAVAFVTFTPARDDPSWSRGWARTSAAIEDLPQSAFIWHNFRVSVVFKVGGVDLSKSMTGVPVSILDFALMLQAAKALVRRTC